jgi:putative tryptophan/tyrosine transport system substrate-binding protein
MGQPVRRRDFITLAGSAAAWPLAARANSLAMPVIGFLGSASPQSYTHVVTAFRQGLKQTGYIEGQNIAIEFRWAQNEMGRLPALAADLVSRGVAVIAASSTPASLAAKAATTAIPIVFEIGFDPVDVGLVASLNQPGSNVTGVTNLGVEVAQKQLELLHELIPAATSMAFLVNLANRTMAERLLQDAQRAAHKLGLQLHVLNASTEGHFDAVFERLVQLRTVALAIGTETLFVSRSRELGALTVHHAIPASFALREFAIAGGLVSYGGSITDAHRLAGFYVGRVLKGDKPADLPVLRATKMELVINLKTAKALGLDVPTTVLARADEVIE